MNYSPHWQCLPLGERRLVLSFGTSALSFDIVWWGLGFDAWDLAFLVPTTDYEPLTSDSCILTPVYLSTKNATGGAR
ncbi:MAG: hypothetical protein MUO80_01225 [Dehalococcoidia bacterium]|nr:hypothetical protein [Dehalococcoidia bacterium]